MVQRKKVGVKDIAKAAGVSIGTVDRVLHNRGDVKAETKDKVMQIVKELGYQPNVFARSLSSKTNTRIVVVIPKATEINPYWEKPIVGINKAKEELGDYNVEVVLQAFDSSSENSFKEVLTKICEEKPNGVILNPMFKESSIYYLNKLKSNSIPYAFMDVDIKGVGKLGYFGQDAEQSGLVSAKLLDGSLPKNSRILIVKQSRNKFFSEHIESRIKGFMKHFDLELDNKNIAIDTCEIDLNNNKEPTTSLKKMFDKHHHYHGIFVPNSRAFKVAEFLKGTSRASVVTLGFDLIDQNVAYLKEGWISYLISQKPEEQAYKAITTMFNYLIAKKEIGKTVNSPIDIVIKENIDFYNQMM